MMMEEKEHTFEVGPSSDDEAETTVIERTQLKPTPAVAVVAAIKPVTEEKGTTTNDMWVDLMRWIAILILVFAIFVSECVVLSHRDVGWVKVIAMSQDKNYDTLVATYGWYDVKLMTPDLILRPPDWSDAVGCIGAFTVMGTFYVIVAILHGIKKGRGKLFRVCHPLLTALGLSGIAVWVLYMANVTTYINTRDFYYDLGGSSLMFLLNHVLVLVASSLVTA